MEEPYRRQGFGSFLLRSVEQEAKEKGAYLALSDGCDWTEDFLFANDYTAYATVEDFPKGHRLHFFRKPL